MNKFDIIKPQAASRKLYYLYLLSLLLTLIGMPFGEKISGRFAYSNVFQIAGFVIIIPELARRMTRKFLLWGFTLVFSMLLSTVWVILVYDIKVLQLTHIAFFTIMGIYVGYFVNRLNNSTFKESLRAAYKFTIVPFFIYFSALGLFNASVGVRASFFGFDDKSHAVLFLSFYSFLALKLLNGRLKFIISIAFMLLALMTISRLIIFFLPFYIYALCRYSLKNVNLVYKILIIILLIGTILFVNNNKSKYFLVFQRVSGNDSAASASTTHHLELIRVALEMKFQNIFNFALGTGPGNFGNLLMSSGVKTFITNGYYSAVKNGLMPIHSSHTQIFLEFSIVIFIAYLWFLGRIFTGNRRNKNIIELCFYIPLIIAVTFYSTHNEVLYWMMLLYLYSESRPNKHNYT